MEKKRYSEEQIIGFLREADAGLAVKELCRKHGFSEASYYGWKAKFGGMNVSEAQRLKSLETENAKLKKLLANSMLEIDSIREVLRESSRRGGKARLRQGLAGARALRASGLPLAGDMQQRVALRCSGRRQRSAARAPERACWTTPPPRLPVKTGTPA